MAKRSERLLKRPHGLSGATFQIGGDIVTKFGGHHDLRDQAKYMKILGTAVCPDVIHINCGGAHYSMDYCFQDQRPDAERICLIHKLLKSKVWGRSTDWRHDWRDCVHGFLRSMIMLDSWEFFLELYSPQDYHQGAFQLIHGDPTLGNQMLNRDHCLVLIDPVPPRFTAPPLYEIDLCALIQSAYGWETFRTEHDASQHTDTIRLLRNCGEDGLAISRAFWWAAYKCERILRHPATITPEAELWALRHMPVFLSNAQTILEAESVIKCLS